MNKNLQIIQAVAFLLSVFVLADCTGGDETAVGEPSPSGSNAYELQPQAMVLDGLPIKIVHVDETTVVLKGQVKGIVAGKILISSEGDGFLRKVISVKNTQDGLRITTSQASLTEAFSKLNINTGTAVGIKTPVATPSSPPKH